MKLYIYIYIYIIYIYVFDWHIYVWLWSILKLKVVHISTTSISEMVKYMANITIAISEEVAYGLSIGIYTVDLGPF